MGMSSKTQARRTMKRKRRCEEMKRKKQNTTTVQTATRSDRCCFAYAPLPFRQQAEFQIPRCMARSAIVA
eukprot:3499770-Pyramimonas_sp.AAC.1